MQAEIERRCHGYALCTSPRGAARRAVVTGSGLIRVTATASLDAAVPGDGAIIYGGNPPHLTTSITGTGAVLRG
jgi:hypothetical protein